MYGPAHLLYNLSFTRDGARLSNENDPFDDHREFSNTIRISSRVCDVSQMIVEKRWWDLTIMWRLG